MLKFICLCHLAQEETRTLGMKYQLLATSWRRLCGEECGAGRVIQQLSVLQSLVPEPFENKADSWGISWVLLAPAKHPPRWNDMKCDKANYLKWRGRRGEERTPELLFWKTGVWGWGGGKAKPRLNSHCKKYFPFLLWLFLGHQYLTFTECWVPRSLANMALWGRNSPVRKMPLLSHRSKDTDAWRVPGVRRMISTCLHLRNFRWRDL